VSAIWSTVYSIYDWYDGPRSGVTEYRGTLYWYKSVYMDAAEWNPDEDRFELTPINPEILGWELERTAIFDRWDAARKQGHIVWKVGDNDSFVAFPDGMVRYRELNEKTESYLAKTTPDGMVIGIFDLKSDRVRWEPVESINK
jgi:hypothetical protein